MLRHVYSKPNNFLGPGAEIRLRVPRYHEQVAATIVSIGYLLAFPSTLYLYWYHNLPFIYIPIIYFIGYFMSMFLIKILALSLKDRGEYNFVHSVYFLEFLRISVLFMSLIEVFNLGLLRLSLFLYSDIDKIYMEMDFVFITIIIRPVVHPLQMM